MSEEMRCRYGLIGAAAKGQQYFRALASVEGADLIAIAETDSESINQVLQIVKQSPFTPTLFSDWREMIHHLDLDALLIAVEPSAQAEILAEILKHDFAVLIELPFCDSLKTAKLVSKAARKRQALTFVGHSFKMLPEVAEFFERITPDKQGCPIMVSIRACGSPDICDQSGGLFLQFSYMFDVLANALQDQPIRVYASAGRDIVTDTQSQAGRPTFAPDNAFITIDFAKGARAQIEVCLFAEATRRETCFAVTSAAGRIETCIPSYGEDNLTAPARLLNDFQRALRHDSASPLGVESGLQAMAVAYAANQSAKSHRVITVQAMGPFNTPMALSREPWTAAFFAFCAPILFPVIVLSIAAAFLGDGQELSSSTIWITACISVSLQFLVMSLWCEAIGAGPFSGAMKTTFGWMLVAICVGPILLYGPMLAIGSFMPEGTGWIFRDGVDPDIFTRPNWTLSFVFYALVLAPIVEEVTYRGVAMGAVLSRGAHPMIAAIIASIAFTLPHVQYSNLAMASVFVTGLGFAALRIASGTIIVPLIAHIAANAVSFIL